MTTVIPVKFTYAARDLWFNPQNSGAQEGDHVICSTERGTEIGLAVAEPRDVSEHDLKNMIGKATLKSVIRIATDEDLDRAEILAQKGEDAMPVFRRLVAQSGLDMKPVGVEYVFGGEKVVCYFAAEERVDFRQLVRDLSRELHERIDMRQIGVREEAAVVGGFGHCGQELCCSRFGLSFEPVSIRMAKEQDLPLTSNKISGACGRLMCCLRYEFEAYRDFKGRAPKRNAVIETPLGKAKVVEYDTPKEQLVLRVENGKTMRIPLGEMIASEAAVKKSEELHCPCRPDTVVRDSLDKLTSPDIQMALAELDRKMGVYPEDTYDESDIFVEPRSRSKRRRRPSEDKATSGEQQQTTKRTRRRRGGQRVAADAEKQQQTAAPTETPSEKKPRRRRRKRFGAGANVNGNAPQSASANAPQNANADTAQGQKSGEKAAANPTKETRRRRHHKSANAEGTAQGAQQQGAQQQGGQQKQRQRRRPGDRAGQKSQEQQQRAEAANKTEGAQKRRRRRRGGRGRGGKKQQGEGSASE